MIISYLHRKLHIHSLKAVGLKVNRLQFGDRAQPSASPILIMHKHV
jgi:hypothetical protein